MKHPFVAAVFTAAFLLVPAQAQVPILEASGPTTVEVGKKTVIKVTTTAKKVTWKIPAGVVQSKPGVL